MEEAVLGDWNKAKLFFFSVFPKIKINFAQPLPKMNEEDYLKPTNNKTKQTRNISEKV